MPDPPRPDWDEKRNTEGTEGAPRLRKRRRRPPAQPHDLTPSRFGPRRPMGAQRRGLVVETSPVARVRPLFCPLPVCRRPSAPSAYFCVFCDPPFHCPWRGGWIFRGDTKTTKKGRHHSPPTKGMTGVGLPWCAWPLGGSSFFAPLRATFMTEGTEGRRRPTRSCHGGLPWGMGAVTKPTTICRDPRNIVGFGDHGAGPPRRFNFGSN
jgi:hypothetical protein